MDYKIYILLNNDGFQDDEIIATFLDKKNAEEYMNKLVEDNKIIFESKEFKRYSELVGIEDEGGELSGSEQNEVDKYYKKYSKIHQGNFFIDEYIISDAKKIIRSNKIKHLFNI